MSQAINDTLCMYSNGDITAAQVNNVFLSKYADLLRVQVSTTKPTNRSSARLNAYKHFAVLSGGLLENDEPTNEIWLLDTSQEVLTWTLFPIRGTVLPRYNPHCSAALFLMTFPSDTRTARISSATRSGCWAESTLTNVDRQASVRST